ncbi:60S ribosomal protein L34-like [Manis pentadactyla]|uniref:60S ribosomal protein L34-like n=1 Tax=Manis pentadactyla TaxID=143292 RepID=UPI00255CA745|nr:60S ribosomal protein L34-like [Manis pentadactyla]
MAWHLTYHHRLSDSRASNETGLSQASGTRIVYLYTTKVGKAPNPMCGMRAGQLGGVRARRPKVLRLSKTKKHISRADGASRGAICVHHRIKHAFLTEEQNIIVKVLKAQSGR